MRLSKTEDERAPGHLSMPPPDLRRHRTAADHFNGGGREKFCAAVAGATAGGVGVIVGQPFDMLKVRMQISNVMAPAAARVEDVAGHRLQHGSEYLRHMLQRMRFLYRGALPPLLTNGLVQSLNFSGFEAVKRTLHPDPHTPAPLPVFWAAGCGGTLVVTLITCPSHRIKIQQQSASGGIRMVECIRQILQTQGVKGLYKGYTIHVLLEGVGRGWYMTAYESMKRLLSPIGYAQGGREQGDLPLLKRMAAGAFAGIVGWMSIYPLDVVRSRMMAQRPPEPLVAGGGGGGGGGGVYSGAIDCAIKTFREGGVRIFFRGIHYTLLRAMPVAACVLPTYDLCYKFVFDCTSGWKDL